jgi:hypothetical protein
MRLKKSANIIARDIQKELAKLLDLMKNLFDVTCLKEIPHNSATGSRYASSDNHKYLYREGIANSVFNEAVGRMQNIVSSFNMEPG